MADDVPAGAAGAAADGAAAAVDEKFDEKESEERQKKLDEDFKIVSKKLEDLSNKYYNAIPRADFARSAIRAIGDHETVKQSLDSLSKLVELQFAVRILLGAQLQSIERMSHPIDYCYGALGIHLRALDRASDEFGFLTQYCRRSVPEDDAQGGYIYDIFELRRKGEAERFAPFENTPNRMLLWHGSAVVNFAGILSQGLRIAPKEADPTGYMFGKGVYFADVLAKSLGYARPAPPTNNTSGWARALGRGGLYGRNRYNAWGNSQPQAEEEKPDPTVLLLLCEVALGTMNGLVEAKYMEKPPAGFDSTKGCGSNGPDFTQCLTTHDGLIIPSGPHITYPPPPPLTSGPNAGQPRAYGLGWNEYIVYNEAQVKMKYLVRLGPKPVAKKH